MVVRARGEALERPVVERTHEAVHGVKNLVVIHDLCSAVCQIKITSVRKRAYLEKFPLAGIRAGHINVEEESNRVQVWPGHIPSPVDPASTEGTIEA